MALSFPLATTYFGGLQINQGRVYLPESLEINVTGGGEVLSNDLGERLWVGDVTIAPRPHRIMAAVEAQLSVLRQAGRSFFAFDPRVPAPISDPTGSILGASSPVIASLAVNNRELTISGLPAGYVLSAGDNLSFAYGSAPTRYALHQIVVGSTANGVGLTGLIEVTPLIRAGASVGASIVLIKPYCKAVYTPGSYQASTGGQVMSGGLSFSFIQSLR